MQLSETSTPLVCMAPAVHADEEYAQIKTGAYQVAYYGIDSLISRVLIDADLVVTCGGPKMTSQSRRRPMHAQH